MRMSCIAVAVCVLLSSPLGADGRTAAIEPEIRKYYDDISYVATHSGDREQAEMVAFMTKRSRDDSFLRNGRLRSVYERLSSLMSVRLSMDPGIFRGPFGDETADCAATATPVRVVRRSSDTVVIEVTRRGVRPGGMRRPALSLLGDIIHGTARGPLSYDEIDTWVRVDGRWRLMAPHAVLV